MNIISVQWNKSSGETGTDREMLHAPENTELSLEDSSDVCWLGGEDILGGGASMCRGAGPGESMVFAETLSSSSWP